MPANNQVMALITIDRQHSGPILKELGARFREYKNWAGKSASKDGKVKLNDVEETLQFMIEGSQCDAFYELYCGFKGHRGELTFYRPVAIPSPIAP